MIFKDENLLVVGIMRVSIFMSENIPSVVDWYYRMPYTKQRSAKGIQSNVGIELSPFSQMWAFKNMKIMQFTISINAVM